MTKALMLFWAITMFINYLIGNVAGINYAGFMFIAFILFYLKENK